MADQGFCYIAGDSFCPYFLFDVFQFISLLFTAEENIFEHKVQMPVQAVLYTSVPSCGTFEQGYVFPDTAYVIAE
ncbi:hypothetical protein LQZ18_08915 [Lachnospiraceae bacterium ZAX-1]